jgi:dipeptidase D
MTQFDQLFPLSLWQYFGTITSIPRPSKKEEKIISYLIDFAKLHNLDFKKDHIGNLLIYKGPSKSKKDAPTVILQSHVDIVCEKNANISHQFETDPIQPYIDGEWVKAKGTTLGADDGIGVAAMLAILSDSAIEHGPLECLFTVDEESGLTGAFELPASFLKGNLLINLDSEDEGELFIGCAGGIDTCATFKYHSVEVNNTYKAYQLSLTGLQGGHSGDEIHRNHGNAIKIMTDFLLKALDECCIDVNRFEGGNLKNAIPREAFATIVLSPFQEEKFLLLHRSFNEKLQQNYSQTEPNLSFQIDAIPSPPTKLKRDFVSRFLEALKACPHGVITWSREIEGLVETSTNLASVKFMENDEVIVTTSQRSSSEVAKQNLARKIAMLFSDAGADLKHSKGYPGWNPNMDSKLLQISSKAYRRLFRKEAQVKAIHAGLECGLFLEKYPCLDMISFGPTIKGAHSPDERLHIPSVKKFWDLLINILKTI